MRSHSGQVAGRAPSFAKASEGMLHLRFSRRSLVRVPGVEPGSSASEADTLSIVLHSQEQAGQLSAPDRKFKLVLCAPRTWPPNAEPHPDTKPGTVRISRSSPWRRPLSLI